MYLERGNRKVFLESFAKKCTSVEDICRLDINGYTKRYPKKTEKLIKDGILFNKGEYVHWIGVTQNVGYWRKANHIHKWFVDNVQDGEDNCDYYELKPSQLEKLLNTCKEVIKLIEDDKNTTTKPITYNEIKDGKFQEVQGTEIVYSDETYSKVEELLPTRSGFFFGGTEYDQWYFEDVKNTITMIEKVLVETDFENQFVVYGSSW